MRFVTLYKPAKLAPPTPKMMEEMGKFCDEMTKAGILLATDGVQPGGKTARIRLSNGQFTVTDGPFTESKELLGGYAVLRVDSMEQLEKVCRRFLEIAGDGESEVFQMFDGPPMGV